MKYDYTIPGQRLFPRKTHNNNCHCQIRCRFPSLRNNYPQVFVILVTETTENKHKYTPRDFTRVRRGICVYTPCHKLGCIHHLKAFYTGENQEQTVKAVFKGIKIQSSWFDCDSTYCKKYESVRQPNNKISKFN